MGRLTVYIACAASFSIGLFFIFVWAPHPWGWQGFDVYYDLGRALARRLDGRFDHGVLAEGLRRDVNP